MKKFLNFRGVKKANAFCPVCGNELIDDFCTVCNTYISTEKTNERLKEKYPHIKKCEKCNSRKIIFDTEDETKPTPKNSLDKLALEIIKKYDEKFPQEIPNYREIAKCNKCGHKWFVDGYKDDNKTMLLLRKSFIVLIVVLFFILMIVIGSLTDGENNETLDLENATQSVQENIMENSTDYQDVTEQPSEDEIDDVVETTSEIMIVDTTASEIVETTTETITEATTEVTTEATTEVTTEATTEVRAETTTEAITEPTTKKGRTVYVTPYGEKYHFSSACAGKNAMARDYNDVKDIFDPCKKCAY